MNYRGVKQAYLVGVLDGKGTEKEPFSVIDYVICKRLDGTMVSYGKVVPLSEEERKFIGSTLPNDN